MNRLDEVNAKHDQLRALLLKHGAEGVWLRQTRNVAWITAGADPSIPLDDETGVFSVLVTPEKRVVYTNNIEITRIKAEDQLQDLGFEYHVYPWYAAEAPIGGHVISDESSAVGEQIQAMRLVLTESEQARYRLLGRDTAAALEEAILAAKPGDTEFEVAGRLAAACRSRGGVAVVNLVASDERIASFRHPRPTDKRVDKYLMVVVCMRRGGLVVAGTRLVYFGTLPADLAAKVRKVAAIDAAAMVATRPGRPLNEVFQDIQAAYAAQGEDDQWQHHHQGGPTGYNSREWLVTPDDENKVQAGMAFAWNPSIVGCKSEDTILVQENDFEIVSEASSSWPMVNVQVDGKTVKRPSVAEC